MTDLKKYIRDLNIIKSNLTKFYYNSASEWLKPEIIECISAVNMEIALYTKERRRREEHFKNNQMTIFQYSSEEGLKCLITKL